MNIKEIDSQSLLAYANILENIINSSLEIARECTEAVSGGFVEKEEIDPFYKKAVQAGSEADAAYILVQKELDSRIKKQIGISFGIRKVQSLIKDFDTFVNLKISENKDKEPIKLNPKDDSVQ